MQFDAEDFFFLDNIRKDLSKSFVGVEGVVDVYWLPYASVFGHGKHKWMIEVYLVFENNDRKAERHVLYDKEANFYSTYPSVLWDFHPVYLHSYSGPENFVWNMEQTGFTSVDPLKILGKGKEDTAGKSG